MLPSVLLAAALPALAALASAASTTAAPSNWISVSADGSASTVKPSVLTDAKGSPTATVDAAPTPTKAAAASASSGSSSKINVVTDCDSSKYSVEPFCAPSKNSSWWIGGNYYVTWDTSYYAKNSSIYVTLNYHNPGGKGVFVNEWTADNAVGYVVVKPSNDWLLNQTALDLGKSETMQNQSVYLSIASNDLATNHNKVTGPDVLLTKAPEPEKIDTSPSNRPDVSVLGLALGLPVSILFCFAMVCGLHVCMRHQHRLGPIVIGGGSRRAFRTRGYSGRAERRMKAAHRAEDAEYFDDVEPVLPRHNDADWELASVHGGAR